MNDFANVISYLNAWRDSQVEKLRSGDADALALKQEIDLATKCLEFCKKHDISPKSHVLVLPDCRTQTPSSQYRVIEDHEVDDRRYWTEVSVNGEHLCLFPGTLIVERA